MLTKVSKNVTMLFWSLLPSSQVVTCFQKTESTQNHSNHLDFSIFDEIQGFAKTHPSPWVGTTFLKFRSTANLTILHVASVFFWMTLMEAKIHHKQLGFSAKGYYFETVVFQSWFCLHNLKYSSVQVTSKTSN